MSLCFPAAYAHFFFRSWKKSAYFVIWGGVAWRKKESICLYAFDIPGDLFTLGISYEGLNNCGIKLNRGIFSICCQPCNRFFGGFFYISESFWKMPENYFFLNHSSVRSCLCGLDRQAEEKRVFRLSYLSGSLPACHPNATLDPIRHAEHGNHPVVCSDYSWHRIVWMRS